MDMNGSMDLPSLTIYPAAVMRISCPLCRTGGIVRKERPPEKDFMVLCRKCKGKFLVKLNLRRYYRKEVSIPVRYSTFDIDQPFDQRADQGVIIDMSREGLCIENYADTRSADYYKEGKPITLFFSLPPREKLLKVQGEVTRILRKEGSQFFKIGVKFCNLDSYINKQIGFFLWP